MSRDVQRFPEMTRDVQRCPEIFRRCPEMSGDVQRCPEIDRFLTRCRTCRGHVQDVPVVSWSRPRVVLDVSLSAAE
jgi:hypothetical protein